jgi:hypothetical protein
MRRIWGFLFQCVLASKDAIFACDINIEAFAYDEGEVSRMHALSIHGIKWYMSLFVPGLGSLISVLTSRSVWIWHHSRQSLRFKTT